MSDREALALYRKWYGCQAEIKGLKRKIKRLENQYDNLDVEYTAYREQGGERKSPQLIEEIERDRDRLLVDNARLRQQLFAKGVKINCNTCQKPFWFQGIDEIPNDCCQCVGG